MNYNKTQIFTLEELYTHYVHLTYFSSLLFFSLGHRKSFQHLHFYIDERNNGLSKNINLFGIVMGDEKEEYNG